jgi:hypothetical protein
MIQEKGTSSEVVVKDNADQPEVQVRKVSGCNERSSLVYQ